MSSVLVLDASYMMVNVVNWQRAMTLVFTNKAEVLEHTSKVVRTVRMEIPMPSVIRLVHAVLTRKENKVKFSRTNVFKRDNFTCQYCGTRASGKDLSLDHVIPRSHGGRSEWTNVVAACKECNLKKADREPHEARMKLIRNPRVPMLVPYVVVETEITRSWKTWVPHLKYIEKVESK